MNSINNGGPAFPLAASTMPNGEHQWHEYGMFSAPESIFAEVSKRAYEIADAMIAAREVKS